jgi:hypothetical protein
MTGTDSETTIRAEAQALIEQGQALSAKGRRILDALGASPIPEMTKPIRQIAPKPAAEVKAHKPGHNGAPKGLREGSLPSKIVDFIRETPARKMSEVAVAMGIAKPRASSALLALTKAGHLVSSDAGGVKTWSITTP